MRIAPLLVPLAVVPLLLVASPGCIGGGSPPAIDCSVEAVPTYDQVGAFKLCSACHSSRLQGAERQGAPGSINYDTYDAAERRKTSTQRVVAEGSMPPPGAFALTEFTEHQVYVWYQCGTPR